MSSSRIFWTITEQSDWYAAFISELKEKKVAFPVKQSDLVAVMEAGRTALKVLKVERRRPITSIDSIRGDVAKRLIDTGVFPRNYLEVLRRGKKEVQPEHDPQAARIQALEAELENATLAWTQSEEKLKLHVKALEDQVRQLEKQPTPLELIENFLARIIAKGLAGKLDLERAERGWVKVEQPKPVDKEAQRAVAEARAHIEAQSNGSAKPKINIVGGGSSLDVVRKAVAPIEDKARFRILDSDKNLQQIGDSVAGADMTFIMMGASSHSAVEMITRRTKFYQRVANFSSDHLRNLINNWLEREWNTT